MARVYSSEYADLPEQANSSVGYYTVVYSYSAGGELYTGKFVDFGRADESYFKRDDTAHTNGSPVVEFKPRARSSGIAQAREARTR